MQTIIRVEKLSKSFNQHQALNAVDLNICSGEMVALLGPSGSGKSTLLRHLSGLIIGDKSPGSRVELLGRTVQHEGRLARDIRKSRAHTGYIFQQFNLVNRLTVLENVLAYQRVSTLSGGQQQRVAIARALMQQAKVILADEPIASLDPESARIVMDTLRDINQTDGITVVVTLHQVDYALRYCERIVALRQGNVFFDGSSQHFDNDRFDHLYRSMNRAGCIVLKNQALLAQPGWRRPARKNRSVHAVREDFEHCPDSGWQVK